MARALFKPGNPGGPGRPRGSSNNPSAKKWAEEVGIPLLLRIASGDEMNWPRSYRWDAIKLGLAYGIGKPREAEVITEEKKSQIDFSDWTIEKLEKLSQVLDEMESEEKQSCKLLSENSRK